MYRNRVPRQPQETDDDGLGLSIHHGSSQELTEAMCVY
jgi:hypothetical protein